MAADIQLTGCPKDPSRSWLGQRAKRTQAIPKHTLQGAGLEIFNDKEMDEVNKINVNEYQEEVNRSRRLKMDRYTPKLPECLKQKGPLDQDLKRTKEELLTQMQETVQAQKLLDTLELNSKYFNIGVHSNTQSANADKPTGWYRHGDLKHSKEINILGLRDTENNPSNYNRDKYGQKMASHQYSGIGDPLKTGMDFSDNVDRQRIKPSYYRARNPDWLPPDAYRQKSGCIQELAIGVPANIQHKFGSRVCKSLLTDKTVVNSAISEQRERLDFKTKKRLEKNKPFKLEPYTIDPVYEDLSHSTRYNVFPGHSYNHKKSWNETVHTWDVFDRKLKDPEQYRYNKDFLSKWAEQNIIRNQLSKLWDEADARKKE